MKSAPAVLAAHEGPLRTRVGAAFPGARAVFRGQDLHTTLRGAGWFDLYLFGITGRRHTPGQLRLLEAVWARTSYPDARLWNNRVAALAGSTRSTGALGLAAALAASEGSIFGRQVDLAAADFLVRARREVEAGAAPLAQIVAAELEARRRIAGYGRPINRSAEDERHAPILAVARAEGLAGGPYVKLAYEVESALLAGRWRMRLNYGGLAAALALDVGLSPWEYYLFVFGAFLAGMPPCYLEALERPERATFPLRCSAIRYDGPARRSWDRRG